MQVQVSQPAAPVVDGSSAGIAAEVHAAPICIGFTAVIAQIVLLRELVVVFRGNEISLGLMLATWLLWSAFGGGLLGRLRLGRRPRFTVAILQIIVAFSFPATIVVVRSARIPFQITPGELLGPGAMLLTSVIVLAVFCTISGWLFAAASRLYAAEGATIAATATGTVYLLEAIGSAAGGLLASLVLLGYGNAFEIALLIVMVNLACAVCLLFQSDRTRLTIAVGAAAMGVASLIWIVPRLESASQARLWRGFRLLESADSVYGRLDVVETGAARSIYENGLVAFHAEDPAAAEEAVQFALLQHPEPGSLLLIGGGMNGSLGQALQHSTLTRIDYVELDPTILTLAQHYFPEQSLYLHADRVRAHYIDGRLFMKTVASRFDVIIVNLPEPQTAQLNRFYTREFFAEAAGKLNPGGLLAFQLRGAENYISPELGDFLRCVHGTLRSVFPEVLAIPGDTIHFFAANRAGMLTADSGTLLQRLRARKIVARYVREYYLPFRMAPDRMRELESELRSTRPVPINGDLSPLAYYFGVTLWSANFGGTYRQLFSWLSSVKFTNLLLVALLAITGMAAQARFSGRPRRAAAGLCAGTTGMVLMALEVLLLLGFQAIYGYVYRELAMVIATFMAGMACGSWLKLRGGKSAPGENIHAWDLPALQTATAMSPLLLYAVLRLLTTMTSSSGLLMASELLFPVMALACGILGGYQFQVASRVYFDGVEDEPSNLAALYAMDLVGACVGAITVSAYLVPVFGMFKTACLIAAVALVPALAALPVSTGAHYPARR